MANLFSLSGGACGAPPPGGVDVLVYYTCTCELPDGMPQTKAQITPAGATPAHGKEYGEPFDFSGAAAGQGFWRTARMVIDENELTNLLEGTKQGVSVAEVLNAKIPGFSPESSALVQAFRELSGCLLFGIKLKSGLIAIVGTTDQPCFVDAGSTGTTGRVIGDVPGYVMNFRSDSGFTTLFYDPSVLAMKTTPNP